MLEEIRKRIKNINLFVFAVIVTCVVFVTLSLSLVPLPQEEVAFPGEIIIWIRFWILFIGIIYLIFYIMSGIFQMSAKDFSDRMEADRLVFSLGGNRGSMFRSIFYGIVGFLVLLFIVATVFYLRGVWTF